MCNGRVGTVGAVGNKLNENDTLLFITFIKYVQWVNVFSLTDPMSSFFNYLNLIFCQPEIFALTQRIFTINNF